MPKKRRALVLVSNPYAQVVAFALAAMAAVGAVLFYPAATVQTYRGRRKFLTAMFGVLAVAELLFTVVYLDGLFALQGFDGADTFGRIVASVSPEAVPYIGEVLAASAGASPSGGLPTILGEVLFLFGIPISVGLSAWSWWWIANRSTIGKELFSGGP